MKTTISYNELFLDEKSEIALLYKHLKANKYTLEIKHIIDVDNFNKLNKLLYRRNFQTLKSFYCFAKQQEGIKFKIADKTKDRTLINHHNYPLLLKQGYEKDY